MNRNKKFKKIPVYMLCYCHTGASAQAQKIFKRNLY